MSKEKIKKYLLIFIPYFLLYFPIVYFATWLHGPYDKFMFTINYVLIGIVLVWVYSLIIIKKYFLSFALFFFSLFIIIEMMYIVNEPIAITIINPRVKILYLMLSYILITIGLIRVVSSIYKMHIKMKEIAYTDELTKLPNRVASLDYLENKNDSLKYGQHLCVGIINMDDFKNMNDNFGRAFGDKVILEYARIIKENNVNADYIGRLASDEYIIIIDSCSNEEEVMSYYKKLVTELNKPISIDNHHIVLSTSIGIAGSCDERIEDYMEYLKKANLSLQYLKKTGKNNFLIYSDLIADEIKKENEIKDSFITAIDHNDIEVFYQPIVPINETDTLSFEALARWKKDGKYLNTMSFILIAEKYGLITYLDYYMLNKVCQEAKPYMTDEMLFAVNISARTLIDKSVVLNLKNIVEQNDVPIERICIEITETAFAELKGDLISKIEALRELGFKISIDDFGIGYSSLSRLKYFGVDYIKIDKLFIDGIGINKDDEALVKGMVNIAKIKGASIVAEGAESKYQVNFLKNNSCDKIQGYYFAKPMPIEDVESFIIKYKEKYIHQPELHKKC